MNIYKKLNKVIEYTEEHLDEKIDYKEISKIIGINEYTFQKIFLIISDISYPEYIRNRRLSNAGQEIVLSQTKIIDIAIKYQYNNATSFSRAFKKFHGVKPSEVRKNPDKLRLYTKLHFDEQYEYNKDINYKVVELDSLTLYGTYIVTNNEKIKYDAPIFCEENNIRYGKPEFGMVEYNDKERLEVKLYWVLYRKRKANMKKKTIPKSKWIQLRINSQDADDIQEASNIFYKDFFPNVKYNFRDLPEIEFYHDNITDFLIPIED